jgi:hypothetical protein
MDRKRKIILSASIIAIAAGAGQLVQSNIGAADRQASVAAPTSVVMLSAKAEPQTAPAPVLRRPEPALSAEKTPQPARLPPPAEATASPPTAPVTMPRAASPGPQPAAPKPGPVAAAAEPAAPAPAPAVSAPAAPQKAPAPVAADTCVATLSATALPGAVLSLGLVAPCDGGARVVLRHGGLAVTAKLSAAGTLFTTLPAMAARGDVVAMFPDGTTAKASAATDLAGIRRFAVQWQADDAFQLQVYENGAAFGAPGHVSAERPAGEGKVDVLGDATVDLPLLAQVYTWPASPMPVEVTIEAAVTDKTCNREILGEAIGSDAGRVTATDITLAMPDCSGVGDFLVLNNLAGGTTLAAAD